MCVLHGYFLKDFDGWVDFWVACQKSWLPIFIYFINVDVFVNFAAKSRVLKLKTSNLGSDFPNLQITQGMQGSQSIWVKNQTATCDWLRGPMYGSIMIFREKE